MFSNPSINLRVRVLANDCRDATAAVVENTRQSLLQKVSILVQNLLLVVMLFTGLALGGVVYLRATWYMIFLNSAGHG